MYEYRLIEDKSLSVIGQLWFVCPRETNILYSYNRIMKLNKDENVNKYKSYHRQTDEQNNYRIYAH